MTVTVAQLRIDFPEFTDTTAYPDSMISFWLNFAVTMLSADRWGDILDMGTELMVAHQLVMARRNLSGSAAGKVLAPQSSKTIDKVSVSYDTAAVRLENGGHWNGTSYGIQFLQLARMVGSGGMQL